MTNYSTLNMFGMPPVRQDLMGLSIQFDSNIPSWMADEHYENCSTGSSWLRGLLNR